MTPPRRAPRHLIGDGLRRKLEVTSAMASEGLIDSHVEQGSRFVALLAGYADVADSLPRYLREMDLDERTATAVRTRVLARIEEDPAAFDGLGGQPAPASTAHDEDDEDDLADEGWSLLRRPRRVVRGVRRRRRRNDELDRLILLGLARAEESVIRTHIDNAIGFVALLEEEVGLDEAVRQYLVAADLTGSRAQTVFQRTMSRLAEVHLG